MVQFSMIEKLNQTYHITNLGVKQALFYVLVGAKMPSILAEVSFISNRDEEKRLADNLYRQKIAEALLTGIKNYLSFKNATFTKTKSGETLERRDKTF